MKIHILGSCAGTEPIPDMNHESVVMEVSDRLYWFDTGEGCSRTGHLMGLDLLKTRSIIISHPHADHTGGLMNLLWNIRKLRNMQKRLPEGDINLYISEPEFEKGLFMMLRNTEGGFSIDYPLNSRELVDGVVFDDGVMKVTAYHNNHLYGRNDKKWVSYSFKIETEGKTVVYSGDIRYCEELDPIIGDGVDALIIETGHFGIDDIRDYTKDKNIGKILFNHNGREIINYPEKSQEKVDTYFGGKAIICRDKMTLEI